MLPVKGTFNSTTIPTTIKANYSSCHYIPNYFRCLNCQHYDNSITTCCRSATCSLSAEVGHGVKSCKKILKLWETMSIGDYKGDYTAYPSCCPNSIREKKILTVKIT